MAPPDRTSPDGASRRRLPRWLAWALAAAVGAALVPVSRGVLAGLAPAAIPVDAVIPGALERGDATMPEDGSWFDDHPIRVERGWRIEARLESDAFDAWLQVFGPDGHPVAQNDDAAPGDPDASVALTARRAGRYTLRANSRDAGMAGPYRLRVRAGPLTPRPAGPPGAGGSDAPRAAAASSP